MLKKAGLIAAASVASLVAVSPLAFAGGIDDLAGADHSHGHGGHDHGHSSGANQNSHGLGNGLNGNNLNAPIQACNNDVQGQVGLVPVQDVGENPTAAGLNGALGILGVAESEQQSHVGNTRACGQDSGGAGYGNH